MKKAILYILTLLAAAGISIGIPACSKMGHAPSLEESTMYEKSTHFENGTFINEHPVNMTVEGFTFGKMINFFFDLSRKPAEKLPYYHLTKESFPAQPADLQVTWLGHSSMILDIDGVRLLIDPVFGNASPVPFTVNRFQAAPIAREELPEVDAVVISHDHYDHLEMSTIKHLAPRTKLFIVPLGVGSHLRKWGCKPEQIVELDWDESIIIKDVEIIAAPTQHFSGRGLGDRFKTLWASFIFKGSKHSAYYTGDGGYDERFKIIGEKYGPFDLTMVECGAYDKGWKDVHMMPEESVQAHLELGGKYMLPVHWGAYDLAFHKWDEPIRRVSALAAAQGIKLLTPQMGEFCIPGKSTHTAWWEPADEQKLAVAN
ncbi:MBL fold metallo-hydrolase [Desulfovibrio sp. JC010]|uniref:MBL fold metallo-hydrolase n=1 Tax=Desulfovibrio sp. JC010 TaxID=2593641 RepID=UPI0013D59699|nr:MBL fold metallo-hydrolase [Desulfovibrio sp. JC010]NDV25213.1 MBL fold metallo-hydrolase [Desulfovibrio sp. JC010]